VPLVLVVFNLSKQQLTVLDVELRHYHAYPKHITAKRDVVVGDLGEDPPVLQLPIRCLMTHPHPALHRPLLRRIRVIRGAIHLILMAEVAPRRPRPAHLAQRSARGFC